MAEHSARLGTLLFRLTLVSTALYSCLIIAMLVSSVCAPWQWDYISTKLAKCLDINSTMLWVFMYCDDDRPFIVLTETKFSFRCIPVWIGTLLTGLGSEKETHVIMFSP